MIASHGTGLAGYPSVIPDFYAEKIEEELQKIKAVLTEITKETETCNQAAA